jgi:Protein of unknown function (DUF2000)
MGGTHNARCVMVIDPGLPPGVRANTAALLGASLGFPGSQFLFRQRVSRGLSTASLHRKCATGRRLA